ncbi:MAG: hypothetical protein KKH02_12595 [Proteobacteria bacterium]|nr:hypothetical protein [Pseudomonadota bacterium]
MKKLLVGLMALLLMLNQATFADASAKADLAEFKAKRVSIYDTKGHPKAKGLRLTIPYPRSWVTEEGRHPNIVQNIKTTLDGKYLISTTIRIKQVPTSIESGYTSTEINSERFRKALVEESGVKYLSSGATKIEGENAFWAIYLQQQSTPMVNMAMLFLSYNVISAGKLITIAHGVSGVANDLKLIEIFDAYVPIFQLITVGIIFPDKWSR